MPFSVKIDRKGQLAKLHKAFDGANRELEENFAYEIASPLWNWPNTTVRSSGQTVGSPRDALDTGGLLNSYSHRREGVGRYVHSWNAPHALIVHNGFVSRSGQTLPARPWTERPVEHLPELFARHYKNGS